MQLANSNARYGIVSQTMHWLTVLFVLVGWCLGQFGDFLPKGAPRNAGLLVHMTLGQCVVVLLVLRLLWRFASPPPPLETTPFGRLEAVAARIGQYTLYALLFVVPFVGIVLQLKRGNVLPVFAIWHVTSPWPADRAVASTVLHVHQFLAYGLLALAFGHASAALLHHWVWRDRTLTRMLPGGT